MIDVITSQSSFSLMLSIFAAGAFGALLLNKYDTLVTMWGSICTIAGSLYGIVFSISAIISGGGLHFAYQNGIFPLLSLSFHVDMLSAFFIFVVSLIAFFCSVYGIGYVAHYYKKYNLATLFFFYNLIISSIVLIVTASNGLMFLIAWEIMAISSYFLIIYDRNESANVHAGYLYFTMTYVATAFIICAFLLIYKYTGSFDFDVIRAGTAAIPTSVKTGIFALAIIGFGTKAGIIPFHIWLPAAHSSAPSHVSATLSGVMIKTGIYMFIRLFLDILQPVPLWWGLSILVIGSISSLLGVLYALTEHDIKRLLAYHSIENIGIILLGVGSAMSFASLGMMPLALLGLTAALFHTLNHAIFKSLLFLSAGSVINEMHTRNMEEYGGLIKFMPQTAFFFLIGSMAISALPPFNGFFSEWLTFQSLFQGIASLSFSAKWVFILAAASLAFTGGLALACFVKAFGSTFLARPRSPEVTHAKEAAFPLRASMAALATLCVLFGIFSGYVTSFIEMIGHDLAVFQTMPSFASVSTGQNLSAGNGFASVSGPVFLIVLIGAFLLVILSVRYGINRYQTVNVGPTWNCGTPLTPRMEITATAFSRSIILIFKGVLKPSIQHEIEYHDAASRYLPKSRTVIIGVNDVHRSYFYRPLHRMANNLSQRAKQIQTGNVNVYILYIFITWVIALFWVL